MLIGTATLIKPLCYYTKQEPHASGPLLCEQVFYQRAAKREKIEDWKRSKKLKHLPVPPFIACGLHKLNEKKLRFLVMPKFGLDLQKLWEKAGKQFCHATVVKVALAMLDALQYMHCNEYVHADLKGANILCGVTDKTQISLVDYGLAFRYKVEGEHKEFKPDKRKAHNGTIEYTSSDAHLGASPSRRGDLEILGYMLVHWLTGDLPWMKCLTNPDKVAELKFKAMKDPRAFVEKLSAGLPHCPEWIINLLEHADELKYDEAPDYDNLRSTFNNMLKKLKEKPNSPIDWSPPLASSDSSSSSRKATKRHSQNPLNSRTNDPDEPAKKSVRPKKATVAAAGDETDTKAKTTAKKIRPSRTMKKKPIVIEESEEDEEDEEAEIDDLDESYIEKPKQPKINLLKSQAAAFNTSFMTSDEESPGTRTPLRGARKVRNSMMPLHTEPVLMAGDKLTGDKKGKHPIFTREKKKNVPSASVETQTTPSLRRGRSRM